VKQPRCVKLKAQLAAELEAEAERHRPRESGGVLLGRTSAGGRDLELTELVGAGPKAKRERHRFTPDGPWQRAEIAERHRRSPIGLAYLGDWHSHPSGGGPSERDRRTAAKIAATERALCPHPIMLIATRSRGNWELRAYLYARRRLRRIEVEVSN